MKSLTNLCTILLIVLCALSGDGNDSGMLAEAKQAKCKELLNKYDKNFFYCTKFSVGKGKAFKSKYRARFTRNMESLQKRKAAPGYENRTRVIVTLAVYEHKNWLAVMDMPGASCKEKEALAFAVEHARVPVDGKVGEGWVTMTERNWYDPMMYYLAVMDCEDEVHSVLGENKYGRVEIEAEMTQDDDQFSYEKQGTITVDTLLLIAFMALFALNCVDLNKFILKNESRNSPHYYCLIAMALQCLAIICDLSHSLKYARDGTGLLVFDVLGTILDMLSECTMTLLLLMLANGWMTRFQKYDFDDGLEVYAPLFMLVIMVHVMCGALSYIDQDAHHKYHDFHGWVGCALVLIKFIIAGIFAWFAAYNNEKIKKQAKPFFQQILALGFLYLLSDPLVILTSFVLDEWNRQYYYRVMDQGIHIFTQTYILLQLSGKRSSYNKSFDEFSSLPGLS